MIYSRVASSAAKIILQHLTFILASLCGAGRTFSKGRERSNNSLRNAINPRLCLFLRDRDAAQIDDNDVIKSLLP